MGLAKRLSIGTALGEYVESEMNRHSDILANGYSLSAHTERREPTTYSEGVVHITVTVSIKTGEPELPREVQP